MKANRWKKGWDSQSVAPRSAKDLGLTVEARLTATGQTKAEYLRRLEGEETKQMIETWTTRWYPSGCSNAMSMFLESRTGCRFRLEVSEVGR